MIWFLILVCFKYSAAKFGEKTSAKSEYLFRIVVRVSSVFKEIIKAWRERWTLEPKLARIATYITNVSFSRLRVATVKHFFSTSYICRMMERTLAVVYNLYLSFRSVKLTLTLLKVRTSIPKVIFMLISAKEESSQRSETSYSWFLSKMKCLSYQSF